MNNRGISVALLYWLVMAVVIIILGIALMSPTKQVIDSSMSALVCTAPTNDFDQGTCWTLDIMKFLFIGGIIGVGFYLLYKQT